ncbi:hypothetical protein Tdes44962_MAKER03304 [Teratosphaeria destructans]|uniref:Uncharacterized protein n=1 Tax=Teratosphaeria destructans TaxID=418781 RepID=A0A9W7W1L9_9PEZI|nr:hypothetical protein Tdes44962_MAKER03304 [Teratosphaeria destructans]
MFAGLYIGFDLLGKRDLSDTGQQRLVRDLLGRSENGEPFQRLSPKRFAAIQDKVEIFMEIDRLERWKHPDDVKSAITTLHEKRGLFHKIGEGFHGVVDAVSGSESGNGENLTLHPLRNGFKCVGRLFHADTDCFKELVEDFEDFDGIDNW